MKKCVTALALVLAPAAAQADLTYSFYTNDRNTYESPEFTSVSPATHEATGIEGVHSSFDLNSGGGPYLELNFQSNWNFKKTDDVSAEFEFSTYDLKWLAVTSNMGGLGDNNIAYVTYSFEKLNDFGLPSFDKDPIRRVNPDHIVKPDGRNDGNHHRLEPENPEIFKVGGCHPIFGTICPPPPPPNQKPLLFSWID